MDIDFPLVLVVLTFATGLIWLADKLFLRERRLAAWANGVRSERATEGGLGLSRCRREQEGQEYRKSHEPYQPKWGWLAR